MVFPIRKLTVAATMTVAVATSESALALNVALTNDDGWDAGDPGNLQRP